MKQSTIVTWRVWLRLAATGLLLFITHRYCCNATTTTSSSLRRRLQEQDEYEYDDDGYYDEQYVEQHLHILPKHIVNFGKEPSKSHLPLHQCQGHCTSHNDVSLRCGDCTKNI